MSKNKRKQYSEMEKKQAKIRGRVCQEETGCGLKYGFKKGLLRTGLLRALVQEKQYVYVSEDKVKGKKKMLVEVTLIGAKQLHNQSPRNKYITLVDVKNGREYRISYRQDIRVLTPEEYHKMLGMWKRKGIVNGKTKNYTQKRKKGGNQR